MSDNAGRIIGISGSPDVLAIAEPIAPESSLSGLVPELLRRYAPPGIVILNSATNEAVMFGSGEPWASTLAGLTLAADYFPGTIETSATDYGLEPGYASSDYFDVIAPRPPRYTVPALVSAILKRPHRNTPAVIVVDQVANRVRVYTGPNLSTFNPAASLPHLARVRIEP